MSRSVLLPFHVEVSGRRDDVTSRAGLPLLVDLIRAAGLPKVLERRVNLPKGAEKVEQVLLTLAAGGDSISDVEVLRADAGLERLLGRELFAESTIREFLYGFHDEALIEQARTSLPEGRVAYIPTENAPLRGLDESRSSFVRRVQRWRPCRKATIDYDATIQESSKREAQFHYKGGRGYQPAVAYWVEQDQVVADQYRDGNVPAGMENLPVIRRAFANLPSGIGEFYFRSDSAAYEEEVLGWLLDPERESGPKGSIGFSISADMSEALRSACEALPESEWKLLEQRPEETVWCADVEFYPSGVPIRQEARRYVALRIRKNQGQLFAAGYETKYLAVVTNRWELSAPELVRWHWEKAGTIEHVHDVTKNELGAAVPPCGRFGANAAWFRLGLLTYNVLAALKALALPPALAKARPKRLRYAVLSLAGKIASHAGRLVLRISEAANRVSGLLEARMRIAILAASA